MKNSGEMPPETELIKCEPIQKKFCSRGAVNLHHSLCLFLDMVGGTYWENMSLDSGIVSSVNSHMGMNANVMLSNNKVVSL